MRPADAAITFAHRIVTTARGSGKRPAAALTSSSRARIQRPCSVRETVGETHLSTQQYRPQAAARLPPAHGDSRRPAHHRQPAAQGAQAPVRLTCSEDHSSRARWFKARGSWSSGSSPSPFETPIRVSPGRPIRTPRSISRTGSANAVASASRGDRGDDTADAVGNHGDEESWKRRPAQSCPPPVTGRRRPGSACSCEARVRLRAHRAGGDADPAVPRFAG